MITVISGSDSAETLIGGTGADEIFAYARNDSVQGGDGDDTLWGGSGNDTLEGGAGDDLLVGESNEDLLDGGAGSDTYRVSGTYASGFSGYDSLRDSGTAGVDRIVAIGSGGVDIGVRGGFGAALTGIEQIDLSQASGEVRLLGEGASETFDLRDVAVLGGTLVIDAGYGNDTVTGSRAADILQGNQGDDVLDGSDGGDLYRAGGTSALGYQGNDIYRDTGTGGADTIAAYGDGDVDIGIKGFADSGIEVIDGRGAAGTVRLIDSSASNLIDLRATTLLGDNIVIDASHGNDTVYGSQGVDTLVSSWGEDVLDGAGGGDTFRVTGTQASGFQGYDSWRDSGTDGVDRIVAIGSAGVDIGTRGGFGAALTGIEQIDLSQVGGGEARLLGENAAELFDLREVAVTGGTLVIDAGGGHDTITGSRAADILQANSGDDTVDGSDGGDLYRVTGNAASGYLGHDVYRDSGSGGTDRIAAIGAGDVDIGVKGFTGSGIEVIDGSGAAGTVRLLDTGDASVIDLRATTLVGGNIVIDASYGNDTIWGSAGADTLVSAGGNDWVDGGEGGDTYRITGSEAGGWSSFQNHDIYRDSGSSGVDRIVAAGAGDVDIGVLGDFSAALSGIEQIDATGAAGTVRVYGDGNATQLDLRGVQLLGSNLVIDSNYGNDTVYGSAAADTLLASWGDDTLDGAGGGDTYRVTGSTASGFQGYDTWRDSGAPASGTDRVVAVGGGNVDIGIKGSYGSFSGIEVIDGSGAAGTVRLLGESASQTLDFRTTTILGTNVVIDAGNGNDVVYGSAGADTFVSNNGEDTLDGAGGGDTYRVTGNTTSGFHGYDTFRDSGSSGIDRVVAVGGDVDIGIRSWSATGIEEIDASGATGTVRLLAQSSADLVDLRGTRLIGSNLVIDAGWGNDTVHGSAGDDLLLNGSGEDFWNGAGGSDTVRISGTAASGFQGYDTYADDGSSGTDRLVAVGSGDVDIGVKGFVGTGIEVIDGSGAAGTVRLLDTGDANVIDLRATTLAGGNIVIDGAYGNDTIWGSAAADTIIGGANNDVLDGGGGGDTYRVSGTESGGWASYHGWDTYRDSGSSGVDRIEAVGSGDVDIGLLGSFVAASAGIEAIDATKAAGTVRIYGDGSSSTLDLRGLTVVGTNVVIDANYGNDLVYGSAGADTLVGGQGDDTLDGGEGGDTYRITGNTANVGAVFQNYDTWRDSGGSGVDRIVALGAGDVDIGFKGSFGAASGIEVIDASGAAGTVRLLGESGAQTLDFRGTTLVGTNVVIDAGNGNDLVYGSAGDDTFVSNNGEDTLDGAGGSDTYRVTGNTTTGFHGYDTWRDTGASGVDRIVAVGSGDVDIGLRGGFSAAASGIEVIDASGAGGTVRLLAEGWINDTLDFRGVQLIGANLVIDAGGANDVVHGSAGDDILLNGSGDDRWNGAGGSDTVRVSGSIPSGFQGYDTYADEGAGGTDRIVAAGSGDVDIGVRGFTGTGIEVIDGTGAAGTVRLLDTGDANVIDLRATTLVGGNIVIDGNYGNDTIWGSAGDDTIVGGMNTDWVDGGEGSDTYRITGNEAGGWSSYQGNDTYRDSGTRGIDRIEAVGGGDVDIGLQGSFSALAAGIEVIDGTKAAGTVRIYGDGSSSTLDLRGATLVGANLVIDANYGNDVVYGSAGADTVVGGGGDDTLDGCEGGDTFVVTGNEAGGWSSFRNHDTYRDTGSTGIDRIVAQGAGAVDIGLKGSFGAASGIEVIDGSGAAGTVRLFGESSAQLLDFRATTIIGANVVIDAGNGNDTVYGSAGDDTFVSNNGEDLLDGAGGGDTYRVTGNTATGFHGYDTWRDSGSSGIDRIVALGAGNVDIGIRNWRDSGIEIVDGSGAAGTVRLLAEYTSDLIDLRGTTIVGTNVVIDASSGNDTVIGSDGADTILASSGEDRLDGGGGGDTFRVTGTESASFSGYDTYVDSGSSGTDRIEAVGSGNVDIGVRGGLGAASGIEVIDGRGASGTVRLLGEGAAERFDLSGMTILGSNVVIDQGWGNDTLIGSAGSDTVIASFGDDWLDGGNGGDVYRVTGSEAAGWSVFRGYDTFRDSGTSGTDRIVATGGGAVDIGVTDWVGTGIEQIDGREAAAVRVVGNGAGNRMDFSTTTLVGGNITLDGGYGTDTLIGSAGDDTLVGGNGDDWLDGGEGSDTYRVTGNKAGGWGVYQDHDHRQDSGTTGTDRLAAYGSGDVDIGTWGWSNTGIEVIDGRGATGTVRLLDTGNASLMDLRGTTVLGGNVEIWADYGDDTVYGSAGADLIVGGGGNDTLDGGEGGDTYRITGNEAGGWGSFQRFDLFHDTGAGGLDRVVASGSGDVDIGLQSWVDTGIEQVDATGAAGTVRLYGDSGHNRLDFSGTTLTGANIVIDGNWGNDTIIGSAGDDTLVGGFGDDVLDGGEGSDTYRVIGGRYATSTFQGWDTWADTGVQGVDRIVASSTGDMDLAVKDFSASGIEILDVTGVAGVARLLGTSSDDVIDLSGTTVVGGLVIDAGGGTDLVVGTAGRDTLLGSGGADSLAGGAGDDVYRVGRGTSLDVIWDWDDTEGNHDVVEFGAGVAIDQLWFQRLDGFLEVSIVGTWDRIYLMDWDSDPAARIEEFRTADGHVLQASQVDTLIEAMSAFEMPSIGTSTLPAAYQAALQPVIAGTWSS
ncbi:calcium-binding protein [Sphaerotilus uruguayifluvii]|uniref:Ca2+-binding RTX toxin-like protein n=1 Tax=Sphaerotilus uruguayifluvii TaxID=2735897 RepID=A0ABX2FZH8_9BURK|nr:Ca2+-binding RTX toxin-like protein [Leptothrix sp. C29]